MVGNVSFNGGYGLSAANTASFVFSPKDIENLSKFIIGAEIQAKKESPLDGMSFLLGFTAIPELWKIKNWAQYNKGNEGLWNSQWGKVQDSYKLEREIFARQGYSVDALKEISANSKRADKVFEATMAAKKLEYYKTAFANKNYGLWAKFKAMISGKTAEEIAADKIKGLTDEATKLATESSSLAKGIEASGEAVGLGAKALKFVKGNALFAAIEGGVNLFTKVIPTFSQLGTGAGVKQLGKSTIKTAASVGGWAVGAEVGAAIGSVIPGAGTVFGGIAGALIGAVCGTIGSWAANKVVNNCIKDELDIAKEKQAKIIKAKALKDPAARQQLLAAAYQKAQEDPNSEEAKIVANSINKLASSMDSTENMAYSPAGQNVNQNGYNPYVTNNLMANQMAQSNTNLMDKDIMSMNMGIA